MMKRSIISLLFWVFLLVPIHVNAAISLLGSVASEGYDFVSGITKSFTLSAGSNRLLLVFVWMEDNTSVVGRVSGITYSGTAMTTTGAEITSPDTFLLGTLYYMLEANLPADGAHDVVVSMGSEANEVGIAIWTFQNVAQVAPKDIDNYSSDSDNSNALTGWTGINATDIVIDCAAFGGSSGTWSQAGTQTELFDLLAGPATPGTAAGGSYDFGVTSMTETVSTAATRFVHIGAAWAEAGGGGGGARRRLTVMGVGH